MNHVPRTAAVIFVVSGSVLLFEVLSTRATKIVFSNDFDFIVLSLAFLGFGIGSMAAHFWRSSFHDRPEVTIIRLAFGCAIAYAISVATLTYGMQAAFFVASAAFYALAGALTTLILCDSEERIGTIYFAVLAGSAFGTAASVAVLEILGLERALLFGLLMFIPIFVFYLPKRGVRLFAVVSLAISLTAAWIPIDMRCGYVIHDVRNAVPLHKIHTAYSLL